MSIGSRASTGIPNASDESLAQNRRNLGGRGSSTSGRNSWAQQNASNSRHSLVQATHGSAHDGLTQQTSSGRNSLVHASGSGRNSLANGSGRHSLAKGSNDSRASFGQHGGDSCNSFAILNGADGNAAQEYLADGECGSKEVTLVELFQNLLNTASKIKEGVEVAIQQHQDAKALKADMDGEMSDSDEEEEEDEEPEEEMEEYQEDENEDEDEEEEDDEDEEGEVKEKKSVKKLPAPPTERRSAKPRTELEQLLVALHMHKRQKQNLMIKKALLLKFEEALFGNNNITMTIDLRQLGEEEKVGKLEEILHCKSLTNYLPRSITENGNSMELADKAALAETVAAASCPPDILKKFKAKTPKKIAINLIRQQYNIRWNTQLGDCKPFDFFEMPKPFQAGIVRKMHVQTVLFEHKADILHLGGRFGHDGSLTKEDVCPRYIYIKKDPYRKDPDASEEDPTPVRMRDEPKFSWQSWDIHTNEGTDIGFDFPSELKWINPKVKILIKKLTTPIPDDFDPERMENIMYLIVVNDTTSKLLQDQGNPSQIYIGAADNGLRAKFLDAEDSHSNRICQLYEQYSTMEAFIPNTTASLVELRMMLALARREPFAVFALQVFDSPRTLGREVHDLVIKALYLANNEIWGPAVNMKFGLNVKQELKKRKRYLPDHFPGKNRKKKGKK